MKVYKIRRERRIIERFLIEAETEDGAYAELALADEYGTNGQLSTVEQTGESTQSTSVMVEGVDLGEL